MYKFSSHNPAAQCTALSPLATEGHLWAQPSYKYVVWRPKADGSDTRASRHRRHAWVAQDLVIWATSHSLACLAAVSREYSLTCRRADVSSKLRRYQSKSMSLTIHCNAGTNLFLDLQHRSPSILLLNNRLPQNPLQNLPAGILRNSIHKNHSSRQRLILCQPFSTVLQQFVL